jgi:hypothetical protein
MASFGSANRLLTEEKAVFDFIESLNDFFVSKEEIQLDYYDFLIKFTEFNGEPRQEAFIRRTLQIIYNKLL